MPEAGRIGIVIVGAGGFGREVLQYVRDACDPSTHRVRGFLDDRPGGRGPGGLPVLGGTATFEPRPNDRLLLAVGDPAVRARLGRSLAARGACFLTLVHPAAYVAASAVLGAGCIVAPFATVGAEAVLGEHVVLTFYSSVGHDARLADFATLSPYSVANGGAVLEEGAFLGTHATVNPLRRVRAYAKVAAGAVVYQDVPAASLAAGNPAKARRLMRPALVPAAGETRPVTPAVTWTTKIDAP